MYPSTASICMNSRIGCFPKAQLLMFSYSMSTGRLQFLSSPEVIKAESFPSIGKKIDQSVVQRPLANLRPDFWSFDFLQSLTSPFSEDKYKTRADTLKEEVTVMLEEEVTDTLSKLETIDSLSKLGLDKYFTAEIRKALDAVALLTVNGSTSAVKGDLYATPLCFRLLRHYGYHASQDMFQDFVDDTGKFIPSPKVSVKVLLELFEASKLGAEGEDILTEAAGLFFIKNFSSFEGTSDDNMFAKQEVSEDANLPSQQSVERYNVKKLVHEHKKDDHESTKSKLIELAKLNFNIVQASHQEDLKELSRWWMNHRSKEKLLSFSRVVESFLYSAGIVPEPKHASLRKWLTKVINLVLIVDDVYNVHGTLNELECFTNAVQRWNPVEIEDLPESIRMRFWTLFNTTNELATQIGQEKGWKSVFPYLQITWTEICKSLLMEAKWRNKGYIPSLEEYLDNGWVSSSGPLLSLLVILGVADPRMAPRVGDFLNDFREIIYHSSLVIRLCSDLGTSEAELEGGDACTSILCYMREANVSEEVAREHIRSLITKAWRQINGCYNSSPQFVRQLVKYVANTARVAQFFQHGDGFGVQDRETRDRVLSNFVEPFTIE